jgi:hypothetical protein
MKAFLALVTGHLVNRSTNINLKLALLKENQTLLWVAARDSRKEVLSAGWGLSYLRKKNILVVPASVSLQPLPNHRFLMLACVIRAFMMWLGPQTARLLALKIWEPACYGVGRGHNNFDICRFRRVTVLAFATLWKPWVLAINFSVYIAGRWCTHDEHVRKALGSTSSLYKASIRQDKYIIGATEVELQWTPSF